MNQKRFAVPVHALFVVPVIAPDAESAAQLGRMGVRRMLAQDCDSASSKDWSAFHIDAASVSTIINDVTELPPPA